MNIAGILTNSIENGEGIRTSIFVSGCRIGCKGCHNTKEQNFSFGEPYNEDMLNKILDTLDSNYIDGITILGGEPMDPLNQEGVLDIIKNVKKYYPNKTIWLYTGYELETFKDKNNFNVTDHTEEIFRNIDVLVDGHFILEERNIKLKFRGSNNQRLINMPKTIEKNEIIYKDC